MKTMPKVGDRVWVWSVGHSNTKVKGTVTTIDCDGIEGAVRFRLDAPLSGYWLFHYSQINRIVKKPRKCEECAKPKELFYVGHEDDITAHCSLIYNHKHLIDPSWKNISTLALISTEEVKK